jgi:hypothetical protein
MEAKWPRKRDDPEAEIETRTPAMNLS